VSAVVRTHLRSFPGFFLSFLGPQFLSLFYQGLIDSHHGLLLVAKNGENVVGFVGGVTDESAFFAELLRTQKWAFAAAAGKAWLRKPAIGPRLWRTRRRDTNTTSTSVAST